MKNSRTRVQGLDFLDAARYVIPVICSCSILSFRGYDEAQVAAVTALFAEDSCSNIE
jgi:hypothetical protein